MIRVTIGDNDGDYQVVIIEFTIDLIMLTSDLSPCYNLLYKFGQ